MGGLKTFFFLGCLTPAFCHAFIKYDKNYVPPGFENIESQEITTSLDVYFLGRVLTTAVVTYDDKTISLKTPDNVFKALKKMLTPEGKLMLETELTKKFPQNAGLVCNKTQSTISCGILNPDKVGFIFNKQDLKLTLFINPKFIKKEHNTRANILPGSTAGVSFLHDVNTVYSGSKTKASYDVGMNTVIGYRESYFDIESTYNRISGEGKVQSRYNIDNALFIVNKWEKQFKAGWNFNRSSFLINQKRFLGVSLSSSLDQITDLNEVNTLPIEKFLNGRSKVEIYKDDRLISSRYYDAGYQKLRTKSLPEGNYDIRVRIEDENGNVTETEEFYSKDPGLPPFGMWMPYISLGVMEQSFDRSKDLTPQQSDKLFAQGGFSRRILPYMAYKQDIILGRGTVVASPSLNVFYDDFRAIASVMGSTKKDYGGYFSIRHTFNDYIRPSFTYTHLTRQQKLDQTNSKFDIIPRGNKYGVRFTNSSKFDNHSFNISYSNAKPFNAPKDNMLSFNFTSYMDINQSWRLRLSNSLDLKKDESIYLLSVSFHQSDKHVIKHDRSYTKTKGLQRQYEHETAYKYNWEKYADKYKANLSSEVASGSRSDSLRPRGGYSNAYFKIKPSATIRRRKDGTSQDYLVQFRTALVNSGTTLALANVKSAENGILVDIEGGTVAEFRVDVNGQPKELVKGGSGTFLAAPAFKTYDVLLVPASDRRFVITGPNRQRTTVYPGNVAKLSWKVTEVYTMAGKVVDNNGQPVANYTYKSNGIKQHTGEDGFINTEVSTDDSEFVLYKEETPACKIDLTTLTPANNGLSFNEKIVCQKI